MPTYKQFFKNRAKHDDIIPSIDPLSEEVYKFTKTQFLYGAQNEDDIEEENADEITIDSSSKHMENEESIAKSDEENNFVDWNLKRVIVGAHQGWVRSVSVDPVTNKWFATGSSDSTIKIWDLATSALKATLTGHIMGVRSLAISSKYPYLFSGSEDKTIRCWDLERTNSKAGSQIRDYYGHVGGIYAMALHPELDLLITGGRDAVIRVWDIRSRTEVMVLPGHRSDVTSIISQGVDPQIVTSSMDSTIRLWDIRKQSTISTLTHHSKSIRSMVRHPQEATICSGDSSGSIRQWVLPSCQLLNAFGESKETNIINTISINPSSNLLFAGFDNGKMQFYDYISGRCLQNTTSTAAPGSPDSAIYASTFDMSGMRLILCEGDKSVKIWGEK